MHKKLYFSFLMCQLLVIQATHGQSNINSFPQDFLGVYKGQLVITNPGKPKLEIPMEFHLSATDSTHRFDYRLIYDEQPRNYTLIVDDLETGTFRVDENNGIILPARLIGNVLHSFFQVEDNLLSSRLAFSENQLEFEILFSNVANKSITGENTEYEIYGYPITTTQRALLTKRH